MVVGREDNDKASGWYCSPDLMLLEGGVRRVGNSSQPLRWFYSVFAAPGRIICLTVYLFPNHVPVWVCGVGGRPPTVVVWVRGRSPKVPVWVGDHDDLYSRNRHTVVEDMLAYVMLL